MFKTRKAQNGYLQPTQEGYWLVGGVAQEAIGYGAVVCADVNNDFLLYAGKKTGCKVIGVRVYEDADAENLVIPRAGEQISVLRFGVVQFNKNATIQSQAFYDENTGEVNFDGTGEQLTGEVLQTTEGGGCLYFVNLGGQGGGGSYVLPKASAAVLGGVKIGSGVNIDADGVISISGSGQPIEWNDIQNKPQGIVIDPQYVHTDNNYSDADEGLLTALGARMDTAEANIVANANGITQLDTDKQDNLVSGTNIKTINNQSLLGSGNIDIQGGSGTATLGRDITTNIAVGGLASGTNLKATDLLSDIIANMVTTVYYPTYTAPSVTLTFATSLAEVGQTVTATATATYNAGAITLQGVKQADRAGAATEYRLTSTGAATELNITQANGNFGSVSFSRASKGNVTLTATVAYAQGAQPKDSNGNDYQSPLPAGNVTNNKTVEFILAFYWGARSTTTINDFAGLTKDLTKKGEKQYTYVTNNEHMVIAYDSSYGNLTSILDPNGFEAISGFTKTTQTIGGQSYNIYAAQAATTATAKYTFRF